MTDEKTRILLVSNERLMRDALLAMFHGCADLDVVGAGDGTNWLPDAAGAAPADVIVVDAAGTRTSSIAAIRRVLERWGQAKVVVVSPFSNQSFVAEVLRAGARGYVTTQSALPELLEAVRTVRSGLTYLCGSVRETVFAGFAQGKADNMAPDGAAMTDREAMILQLFGEGRTSKEIAIALNLSSKTIDACRRQLMQKLDVENMAGLVKCAIALGLTTAAPWPASAR